MSSSWTARRSKSSVGGRSTVDPQEPATISGGMPRDYMMTRRVGAAAQFENGIVPEDPLEQVWPSHPLGSRVTQCPDDRLVTNHPDGAGGPARARTLLRYGFSRCVVDTTNLEGLDLDLRWRGRQVPHREDGAEIPDRRQRTSCRLCGIWRGTPLVTDIDLALWMTGSSMSPAGEPVRCASAITDPRPKLAGSVHVGGIARAPPTRAARCMQAARRWLRSATMASGSTGQLTLFHVG